ncbi:MAG: hypothetical protein IJZ67_06160 [Alistipes sp.]|nr:hypothetical protein [Alistipes sp.]
MLKNVQNIVNAVTPDRCIICDKPLVGSYRRDQWGQKACVEHTIVNCSSCGRMTLPTDIHLADGRSVCSFCKGKVVSKIEHIEWVYSRIQEIFEQNFLSLPGKIPVELVTSEQMMTLYNSPSLAGKTPSGLTVSGGSGIFGMPMRHKVYMLDYLHKVVFGGVLAHELLHVWQNEHHILLPTAHCEGFCNMGTYLFYTYLDNELSEKLAKAMMASPDPIYGEGFRQVKAVFEDEGGRNLEQTVEILVKQNRR